MGLFRDVQEAYSEQRKKVVELYLAGTPLKIIAHEFEVTPQAISKIVRRTGTKMRRDRSK